MSRQMRDSGVKTGAILIEPARCPVRKYYTDGQFYGKINDEEGREVEYAVIKTIARIEIDTPPKSYLEAARNLDGRR